jgi:hypothetical protein
MSDRFQHLAPLEHFLHRPEVSVGSLQGHQSEHWILVDGKAQRKTILYCEAAKKLFDEVLNNSTERSYLTLR